MSALACCLGTLEAQSNLRKKFPYSNASEEFCLSDDRTEPPIAVCVDDAPFENGHTPLAEAFKASRKSWAEMNAKATPPVHGAEFAIAFIADQDEASHIAEKTWQSFFAWGMLKYNGTAGDKSYSLNMVGETGVNTSSGDKSKRGAEYSALEVFDGKLLTFCDRTGNVDEIVLDRDSDGKITAKIEHLVDGEGKQVSITMGDGAPGSKPLKIEWSTQKGGKLIIGSTGKERTDDDGNVVHEGEMWSKVLEPGPSWAVTHVDTRPQYKGLRAAAKCPQGNGYMIHESGRWSSEHKMWMFAPRKLSRKPYDEVIDASKCVNLMLAAPDPVPEDGVGVAMQAELLDAYLGFSELRGCSDFFFVPGTRDCHIFVMRTEETLQNVISSYASVLDLEGTVLMPETVIMRDRKFEGACYIGGFKSLLFPEESRKPEVVFVLGGPGAGKGTQCANIVKKYGWCHLSAGDLLRAERAKEGSADADLINSYIKEGKIVPVEITVKLLLAAMQQSKTKSFLVDGFPRSLDNYEGWCSVVGDQADVACCLFYECGQEELERRLLDRGKTSGRDDDNIESIKKRFVTFMNDTSPVVEVFEKAGKLRKISSEQSVQGVWTATQKLFDSNFQNSEVAASKPDECVVS